MNTQKTEGTASTLTVPGAGITTSKRTKTNLPPEEEVVKRVQAYFFSKVSFGVPYMLFGQENICSGDRLKEVVEEVVKIVMKQIKKIQKERKTC